MAKEKEIKIIQPLVERKPVRYRGPLSSEDYNNFQDQVVHDIIQLSTAANTNYSRQVNAQKQSFSDAEDLRRRIASLEESKSYREFTYSKLGVSVDRYIDFHNPKNVIIPETISADKVASFNSQFGEILLPANAIENKFYNFSIRTREIVVPADLSVEVTGIFDKNDGNGTQDYETGGTILEGTPEFTFNGINETVWNRTVSFPLESNIDMVEVQLTAVVPAGISSQANLIEVVPSPEGLVDVMELSTAPDVGSAFTMIDDFEATNNIFATRYHFSPRSVEQVRIRLRSRNWREINGKKVFTYGLRELGLKLADYNKTYTDADGFGQNVTAIIKVDAPTNSSFDVLYRVDPAPNFLLEDIDKRHIRLRLSTTEDFTGVFWDSSVNTPPQLGVSTGIDLNGATALYAIYTLKFVDSTGGFQTPFNVGTTPYARGLGLLYKALPNSNN
jgi:hypothetical protein